MSATGIAAVKREIAPPERVWQVSRSIGNDLRNGARGIGIGAVFPSDEEEFASTDNIVETENSDKIDRTEH